MSGKKQAMRDHKPICPLSHQVLSRSSRRTVLVLDMSWYSVLQPDPAGRVLETDSEHVFWLLSCCQSPTSSSQHCGTVDFPSTYHEYGPSIICEHDVAMIIRISAGSHEGRARRTHAGFKSLCAYGTTSLFPSPSAT